MRVLVLTLALAGCGPREPQVLLLDQPIRGSLTQHDEQVGDGSLVDRYVLDVPFQQRVVLTAASDDFPAFLALEPSAATDPTILTGQQFGTKPACVAIESQSSLRFRVAVSSAYSLALGSYQLRASLDGPLPEGCRVHRLEAETTMAVPAPSSFTRTPGRRAYTERPVTVRPSCVG